MNYFSSGKTKVEDIKSFSVKDLKRFGGKISHTVFTRNTIVWSFNGEKTGSIDYHIEDRDDKKWLTLDYTVTTRATNEQNHINYTLPLVSTPCYFGGERYWIECNCGRRVGTLYNVGDYFLCRHCGNLTYEARNESKRLRGGIFRFIADEYKAVEMEKKLRVRYYKGEPTKRYKKIQKLRECPCDPDTLNKLLYQHGI